MNLIEHIWGIMKSRIEKRRPKNRSLLIQMIEQEWDNIGIETIRSCISHCKEKLPKIIESQGEYVKH